MQNFNPPPSKVRILSRTLSKNRVFLEATQTHAQQEDEVKNFTALWDFRGHLLQDWGPLTNTVLIHTVDTKNQVVSKF